MQLKIFIKFNLIAITTFGVRQMVLFFNFVISRHILQEHDTKNCEKSNETVENVEKLNEMAEIGKNRTQLTRSGSRNAPTALN